MTSGPVLTHRTQIVRLALQGKTTTQICQIMHHSPEAVANYLSTFTRCAQLADKKMQVGQIAFLLRRGPSLIKDISTSWPSVEARSQHGLSSRGTPRIGSCGGGKKNRPAGGPPMSTKPDFVRKKFGPLRDKTLRNALAHRIVKEFPRIGGPRICQLCADMILEVIFKHMRPQDHVTHGQVLWMAVSLNEPTRPPPTDR